MLRLNTLIFSLLFLIGCHSALNSAEYGYHPSNTLFVGAGLDGGDPTTAHPSCVNVDVKPLGGGADSIRFEAKMVKSRKELYNSLSISTGISARYSFFSGSAGLSFDDQYSFASDELVWMVYGFTDYGRFGIATRPNLISIGDDSPAEMIKQKRYADFADACGTDIVTQERRAVWAAVIYSANGLSESSRRTLETNFSASLGTGIFSADVQAKYKSFVAQAAQLSQIKISAYGIGGGGISDISSLVVDYTDVNKVSEALSRYMKTFNNATAVPIDYYTQSMKIVGWKQTKSQAENVADVDSFLSEYYDLLQSINSYERRSKKIYDSLNDGLSDYMNQSTVDSLEAESQTLFDLRKDLRNLASACNQSPQQCGSDSDIRKRLLSLRLQRFEFVGAPELKNSTAVNICNDDRQIIAGAVVVGQTSEIYKTVYLVRVPGDWHFVSSVSFIANGEVSPAKQATATEISHSAELSSQPKPNRDALKNLVAFRGVDEATLSRAASRWTDQYFTLTVPNDGGFTDTVSMKIVDTLGNTTLKAFTLDKPQIKRCQFNPH